MSEVEKKEQEKLRTDDSAMRGYVMSKAKYHIETLKQNKFQGEVLFHNIIYILES